MARRRVREPNGRRAHGLWHRCAALDPTPRQLLHAMVTRWRVGLARDRAGAAGMVTAETATVLPFLVLVTLALAWLITIGIAQVRCLDAAREAARVMARGDGSSAAVDVATQVAPSGAQVRMNATEAVVDVEVTVGLSPPVPLLGQVLSVPVSASATAALEDGYDAQ